MFSRGKHTFIFWQIRIVVAKKMIGFAQINLIGFAKKNQIGFAKKDQIGFAKKSDWTC